MRESIITFILLSLLAIFFLAFSQAPTFNAVLPPVSQYYVEKTYTDIGITNVISAVNFDWRGFDTFGEATLLLTAAVGIKLILRRWVQRRRETGKA